MNLLHTLGLDSNEIYGGVLILIALLTLIFPYIRWKKNDAWKRDEGEKTKFTDIWKPVSLFGTLLFFLIGIFFWFLEDILNYFKPQG